MAWLWGKVRWGIRNRGFARKACKPDSVQGLPLWMIIPLPPLSPTGSSCQPGPLGLKHPCVAVSFQTCPARGPYLALLRVGLAMPSRLPGPRWALTPPFHHRPDMQGRLFSVALSLGLPPPGVTRHPCLMESGLSSIPDQVRDRDHPAFRARGGLGPAGGGVNGEALGKVGDKGAVDGVDGAAGPRAKAQAKGR